MRWLWIVALFTMSVNLGVLLGLRLRSLGRAPSRLTTLMPAIFAIWAALNLGEAPRPLRLVSALLLILAGIISMIFLIASSRAASGPAKKDRNAV